MTYQLSDYDFKLSDSLIAQYPTDKRDASRLLAIDRKIKQITDFYFSDLLNLLNPNDLLIMNNTKVIPARLYAKRSHFMGKNEILLIRKIDKNQFWALIKPAKKAIIGSRYYIEEQEIEIIDKNEEGLFLIRLNRCENVDEFIEMNGHEPLPPYIKRQDQALDKMRYQTVYAKELGAVAAPTAGLHFTEELIRAIQNKGVKTAEITLHVGLGTFKPIVSNDIREHYMHKELYNISTETANLINETKQTSGRVIAVGTTSMRALESATNSKGEICSGINETDLFIFPGYSFKIVDALITNFHTPKSSLLILVSAFAGVELIRSAYRHAIHEKYRFFSYGDACFIS